ncbi:MAG: hypothetical protein CMJ46_08035 [Planctomyces sp.]|nr:hypothetical protein [Planctomyces sp.]
MENLYVLLVILLVARAFGALAAGMNKRDSIGIGTAMSAGGAVELIIADIALQAGLFSKPTPVPAVIDSCSHRLS